MIVLLFSVSCVRERTSIFKILFSDYTSALTDVSDNRTLTHASVHYFIMALLHSHGGYTYLCFSTWDHGCSDRRVGSMYIMVLSRTNTSVRTRTHIILFYLCITTQPLRPTCQIALYAKVLDGTSIQCRAYANAHYPCVSLHCCSDRRAGWMYIMVLSCTSTSVHTRVHNILFVALLHSHGGYTYSISRSNLRKQITHYMKVVSNHAILFFHPLDTTRPLSRTC